MPKLGHPLREIPEFDPPLVARLRDEYSVTTAEEFVGLWRSVQAQLRSLLGSKAEELASAALRRLSPEQIADMHRAEQSEYPYRTGHDAPPAGKSTF